MNCSDYMTWTLSDLGMSEAFDADAANLSGITESVELFVNALVHTAVIKVDEEGTEAASLSLCYMDDSLGFSENRERPEFTVDRPFLYIIKDNRADSLILFIGSVTDP